MIPNWGGHNRPLKQKQKKKKKNKEKKKKKKKTTQKSMACSLFIKLAKSIKSRRER